MGARPLIFSALDAKPGSFALAHPKQSKYASPVTLVATELVTQPTANVQEAVMLASTLRLVYRPGQQGAIVSAATLVATALVAQQTTNVLETVTQASTPSATQLLGQQGAIVSHVTLGGGKVPPATTRRPIASDVTQAATALVAPLLASAVAIVTQASTPSTAQPLGRQAATVSPATLEGGKVPPATIRRPIALTALRGSTSLLRRAIRRRIASTAWLASTVM